MSDDGRDERGADGDSVEPDIGANTPPTDAASTSADGLPNRKRVAREVVWFARALRREGLDIQPDAAIVAARALVELGARDRDVVRAAMRASLITEPDASDAFERLFPTFWHRLAGGDRDDLDSKWDVVDDGAAVSKLPKSRTVGADDTSGERSEELERETASGRMTPRRASTATDDRNADGETETDRTASYSPRDGARRLPAADPTGESHPGLSATVDALMSAIADRPGRRWTRGDGGTIDARRAIRSSFATGGTVVDVPKRVRNPLTIRATLLVDVSRSVLDVLDRQFLLEFLHEVVAQWQGARVFFFDTDLAEVTDEFASGDFATTVAALERAETRWGGGTRVGESIETLRRQYPDAIDRRTAVFVVSDGLETGDVADIERGVTWLARRGRLLFWLNPLAGLPGYEPSCRGMAAARPYVDGLFAFEGPAGLDELTRQLWQRSVGGPLGYAYESRASERAETEED